MVQKNERNEQILLLVDCVGAFKALDVIDEIDSSALELVTKLDPHVFDNSGVDAISFMTRYKLAKESLLAAYLSGYEDCREAHCAQNE